MCVLSCFSHVWLFVTPWSVACQAPLSMGFSRQEYWSGLPWPPLGNIPNREMEPTSPALASRFFTISATWEAPDSACFLSNQLKLQLPALVLASPCHTDWGVLYREEPHQCESHLVGAGAFFQGLNLLQIPPTFYFSPKISIRFFQIIYPKFIIIRDRVSPTQATEQLLDLNIFHFFQILDRKVYK